MSPNGGVGRFAKTAIIGGVIGGVLSSIPVLNLLNCCFCLLNIVGAHIGVSNYLKANPSENISNGDAAASGAISGAVAGVISGIVGFILNLVLGTVLVSLLHKNMSPQVAQQLTQATAGGAGRLVMAPFLYAGMGAIGGLLSMQLFNKARLKQGP